MVFGPWQRGRTNPFRHFALRNATSPEGGGLGKTGRSRPHSLTAGRSQQLICKLSAPAKASPFRERWHGEAVTERVDSRMNPLSLAALDSSPEGRALGRTGRFRPHRLLARRSLPLNCKLFASAKASTFGGGGISQSEMTEGVSSGTNPLSRLRRQLSRRESPWQRGQVSSSPVNGRKKPAVKLQTFRPCQSLSLSGEVARRSRDGEGSLPFSAVGKDSLARFPLKTVQKNAPVCYTSLCASGFCAAAQFCGGEKPPKTTL